MGEPLLDLSPSPNPSSGTRYKIKEDQGDSFSITCSPDVVVSGTGDVGPPSAGGQANGYVNYKASAEPLEVVLSGGYGPKHRKEYLIGQSVGATLSTGGLTADSYNWTVSGGRPFKSYNANTTYGRRTELGAETGSSLQFHFSSPNNGTGTPTVTCTAHLAVPTGHSPAGGLNVTQERECGVDKPLNQLAVYIGTTQPNPAPPLPNPVAMRLFGTSWTNSVTGGSFTAGIRWTGSVTTPSKYGNAGSPSWHYTQLITPGRSLRDGDTGMLHTLDPNGELVLDHNFVYPHNDMGMSGSFWDDGTLFTGSDSPGNGFAAPFTNLTVNEGFVTYTMYRPPGGGSTFVPLKNLDWYWQGAASVNSSNVWSVSNTAAMWSFLEDFPRHPEWNHNVAPLTFSPAHPNLP